MAREKIPPVVSDDCPPLAPARRAAVLVALLLIAGYALPLFVPPQTAPSLGPPLEASLFERIFPGVPAAWILLRLAALIAGAVLAAWSIEAPLLPVLQPAPPAPPPAPELGDLSRGTAAEKTRPGRDERKKALEIKYRIRSPGIAAVLWRRIEGLFARQSTNSPPARWQQIAMLAALVFAAAHVVAAGWAAQLNWFWQCAYLACLAVPPLLVALGARSERRRPPTRRLPLGAILATGAVLLIWLVWRVPASWHSPRLATPVDTWLNFGYLTDVLQNRHNLLTHASQQGVPDTYMVFMGIPWLAPDGDSLRFAWVQAVHVPWIVATGAGVGLLAGWLLGAGAAPVATAALMFSPFLLFMPLNVAPWGVPTTFGVGMMLLLATVYLRRSLVALVALGAVAGIAASIPQLLVLAVATFCTALLVACRRPHLPAVVIVTFALTFAAAVLPGMRNIQTLFEMTRDFILRHSQWGPLELVMLGQSPLSETGRSWLGQATPPLDIPLGLILAPFAIPRTPLRLWGDTLMEPLGAGLAMVGVAVCVRHARARGARALLALLTIALLPGLTSSYDRVSLTRIMFVPPALALFAAIGLESVRRAIAPRTAASAVALAAVILMIGSGVLLFDVVNPRILRTSSLELSLRALEDGMPPGGAAILEHANWGDTSNLHWLHVGRIAEQVPPRPISVLPWDGVTGLRATDPVPALLLWSLGLEYDGQVSERICQRWPDASLYVLSDAAGLSRAFAARLAGPGWRPALPAAQWSEEACRP